MKKFIKYQWNDGSFVTIDESEQKCLYQVFQEEEMKKPPHMRSNTCMIVCPCPLHRIYC